MKQRLIMLLALFTLALASLPACTTEPVQGADIGPRFDEQVYKDLIAKYTRHDVQYDGFYQRFEINCTFVNSEVQAAILQKRSDIYQWNAKQAQAEREKMFQDSANQTRFALSFFTPNTLINDLNKAVTIWKIYMEVGGKRYEGHAAKRTAKLEDIRSMYPYHNRFAVAYEITFDVPLTAVEKDAPVFTITSPQGTANLKF